MPNRITFTLILLSLFCSIRAQVAVQPAKENVLLLEEFNPEATASWPELIHGDTASARVVDGNYVLDAWKASRFWALRLAIPSNLPAKPSILEMRMKVISDSNRADYGILWHSIQESKSVFDEYAFLISQTGEFTISFQVGGKKYSVKEWTPCGCIKKNDYNILRLERTPDRNCRFFINNQFVYQRVMANTDLTTMGFYSDAHSVLKVDYLKLATQSGD
jgi:hypothetical protein